MLSVPQDLAALESTSLRASLPRARCVSVQTERRRIREGINETIGIIDVKLKTTNQTTLVTAGESRAERGQRSVRLISLLTRESCTGRATFNGVESHTVIFTRLLVVHRATARSSSTDQQP